MTDTTTDQGDERRAFHRHIQATEQREALLWSQVWANSMQDGPMPAHMEGKYLIDADQKAWLAWQAARALSSAQPMAQEAIAWSLRFDDDPRLNLSTVFDTEDEAKNYAARCGSATPVPLFAAPQPSQGAEPVALRPYEPTEDMRQAAKRIDPALPMETIRAIWSAMWSATPHHPVSAEAGKGVEPIGYFHCNGKFHAVMPAGWAPSESVAVSGEVSDADLAKAAHDGFDNYWHEDCAGKDSEAWLASAKAVLALAGSAKQSAALERMARLDDDMGLQP